MVLQWLAIIVLGVFVYRQAEAIRRLETRLDEALKALMRREERASPAPVDPQPEPAPKPRSAPAKAPAAPVASRPAPVFDSRFDEADAPERPEPKPEPAPRPAREGRATISTWLAENGLAWIGGGGLALGGLLLVVYAAQQGVFTPPLRIAAATLAGGLMLAASEWILRQKRAPGGRHLLAAAVAAGAGAVTLYGAVCAAYALYDLIPFTVAAVLSGAVSLGLLGLSLRHGEPLALLAVVGTVITPWVTGVEAWAPGVLLGWGALIGVTGFAISAVRTWGRAAFVTVAGLSLLSLIPALNGGAVLILLAAAGPAAAVFWRHGRDGAEGPASGRAVFDRQPMIALILTAVVSVHPWFHGLSLAGHLPGAVLLSGALVVLGAGLVSLRLVPSLTFAAPVGAATLYALLSLSLYSWEPSLKTDMPWLYGLGVVIPLAAFVGALRATGRRRGVLLGAGGIGTAVLASLAWPLLDQIEVQLPWLPAALLGAALFGSAAILARQAAPEARDRGLTLWLAAAAELSFLAIHAAVPDMVEPVAFAAASLILCVAAVRLGWPGLAQAAVAGALATLMVLFQRDFIGATLEGRLSLPPALAVSGGAAMLLYAGARLMRSARRTHRNEGEAQGVAALMVLLTGLFIGLHVLLSGAQMREGAGALFEASLRTVLLLSAGLLLTIRRKADDGPIARWRTLILISVGVLHGAFLQGLIWNPWWGAGAAPAGVPVLNTLMIDFLAPALLLAACGARQRPADGWSRGWTATGIAFGVLWLVLTLRHLFTGEAMSFAAVGRAEACAYAVLFLLLTRAFARSRAGDPGLSQGLRETAVPVGWFALGVAAVVFGYLASPWWGPVTTPMSSLAHVGLLFGLYLLGAASAARLLAAPVALARAATGTTVLILFALLSLMIRFAFHGPAMGGAAPGSGLETWTFSALWAAFGLATLALGAGRRNVVLRWAGLTVLLVTAAKVLIFDLARLEGVIRAGSFLAVGALLLVGALAARRLGGRRDRPEEEPGEAD